MTGIFSPPLVSMRDAFEPDQRARAAALLIAAQVRPEGSLSELIHLAMFVHSGYVHSENVSPDAMPQRRLPEVFGEDQMDLHAADPSVFAAYRTHDPVETRESEDDGLG